MKKQSKAKTKAAASVKPDAAKTQAAKVKTDKPAKIAGRKVAKGKLPFVDELPDIEVCATATDRELLEAIIKGLLFVADRLAIFTDLAMIRNAASDTAKPNAAKSGAK